MNCKYNYKYFDYLNDLSIECLSITQIYFLTSYLRGPENVADIVTYRTVRPTDT